MNKATRFFAVLLVSFSVHVQAAWFSDDAKMMGTLIHVEVSHNNETLARSAIQHVFDEMQRINDVMSPYESEAELYKLNLHAHKSSMYVSIELFDLITESIKYSRMTKGAFDITYASVGYRYDFRRHIRPSGNEIEQLLPAVDYRNIKLDPEEFTIQFGHPDLKIDLGGIAKGHAVDNAIEILKELGIHNAIVTAGGDSRILGTKDGRPWNIGIKHPREDDETSVTLPLENVAVSTSGDYERYFLNGDERIHHILNPKTGKPSKGIMSVTILAPDATTSDVLSTSVFVMGIEKGMALVENIDEVDAVIIDDRGDIYYSSGFVATSE